MTIVWHAMCGECGTRGVFESDERRELPANLLAWLYNHDSLGSVYYFTKDGRDKPAGPGFWRNVWEGLKRHVKRLRRKE